MKQQPVSWEVLVDFDGTIARDDPTDRILERFADPLWRVLEEQWQCGRISSRACMQGQVELLRLSPEALDEQIRNIKIDPAFPSFLAFCKAQGGDVKIVSDGLDRVVEGTLSRAGLAVPFYANRLEWQGRDRWRLALPHTRPDCRSSSANCKCAHGDASRCRARVVVGDGRSDFCAALSADYVIAKGALAVLCRGARKRHTTFDDFHDVISRLAGWLARKRQAAARSSRGSCSRRGVRGIERRCAS